MTSILKTEKPNEPEYREQFIRNQQKCPLCKKNFTISVKSGLLKQIKKEMRFPYAHLHVHGNPLHAMLCYIDNDLRVRSIKIIKSIDIVNKN